ncbi:MAG TPA: MFS transporter [Ktedonobacteraceae bacterium]|jgi:DHA3 family tetracycline resistance protein-like MFS transporter|nr:MFS transporter [Ktedonobacteraceae bacterium]
MVQRYGVYLILSGAYSLFFATITTINLVYQIEIAKLNPLQLVLVGTALETVAFLCQVPTGILADVFSRRLSVIFGLSLLGAAFVIEGSFPNFVVIMVAQALFGIGATFMNGAEQAWITGEVGEERVGHVFIRSTQVGLKRPFLNNSDVQQLIAAISPQVHATLFHRRSQPILLVLP